MVNDGRQLTGEMPCGAGANGRDKEGSRRRRVQRRTFLNKKTAGRDCPAVRGQVYVCGLS